MHGVGRVKIALFMKIAPDYPHKKCVLWISFFWMIISNIAAVISIFFFFFFSQVVLW